MKNYIRTLGLIFSVVLNIAFAGSYAYRALASRPAFVYEEMRLSDEQRARMISTRDPFIGRVDGIREEILELQVALMDAIAADPPDQARIPIILDEIHKQQRAIQRAVVEHLLEDKSILRPDQRQQFFALLKERIRSQMAPWSLRERKMKSAAPERREAFFRDVPVPLADLPGVVQSFFE